MVNFTTLALATVALLSGSVMAQDIPCNQNSRLFCGSDLIKNDATRERFRDLVFGQTAQRPKEADVYHMIFKCDAGNYKFDSLCKGSDCRGVDAGQQNAFCPQGTTPYPY